MSDSRMKASWWGLVVLCAFGTGWLAGRQSAPALAGEAAVNGTTRNGATAGAAAREASRKQWGAKLDDLTAEQIGRMVREIPRKDLGPSIEAWFDSYGIGGLDSATVLRAWSLIDAWVAEDFESAWAWANSIQQPATREFIMKAIAGSLAESDPQRAFDCLIANGDFRSDIGDDRLVTLMQKLSAEALQQGPGKFVEFWKRLPLAKDSVSTFVGVGAEPGAGTDFLALQRMMDRELGTGMDRPVNPNGVMAAWTKADPQAALDYLVNRAKDGASIGDSWSEMRSVIRKGEEGVNEWTLGVLRGLPEGERGSFVVAAGYVNMPGLLDALRAGATEEESAAWMSETLQAGVDQGRGEFGIRNLLAEMPVEQRIRILKELRGPKAFEAVKSGASSWNLTEGQMAEIRQEIERK